jgi:hypothetical protein
LADNAPFDTMLPAEILNLPARTTKASQTKTSLLFILQFIQQKLLATFVNQPPRAAEEVALEEHQPTITTNPELFLECCEKFFALRSFYNYSGEHCHHAIPRKVDRELDIDTVKELTREVGDILKAAVNRGEGTNQWKIPKFIDMLLLPEYMRHLGSTGRFHVRFF